MPPPLWTWFGTGNHTPLRASPGRDNPADEAWSSSRKPLIGRFSFRNKPVLVIANRFNSKGGDQASDHDPRVVRIKPCHRDSPQLPGPVRQGVRTEPPPAAVDRGGGGGREAACHLPEAGRAPGAEGLNPQRRGRAVSR